MALKIQVLDQLTAAIDAIEECVAACDIDDDPAEVDDDVIILVDMGLRLMAMRSEVDK